MKVHELFEKNPEAVRFGLCIKGIATGVEGVLIPPFDNDFDATAHFFHKAESLNGYGHFYFKDCKNEVVLDENGSPVYRSIPSVSPLST